MGKLIIDGKNVYEVDEKCLKKRKIPSECKIYEKLKEMEEKEKNKVQEKKLR